MGGKAVLTGNLKFTSLADLFQIIGGNNSTGTLRITSQYVPHPGIVHFVNDIAEIERQGQVPGIEGVDTGIQLEQGIGAVPVAVHFLGIMGVREHAKGEQWLIFSRQECAGICHVGMLTIGRGADL